MTTPSEHPAADVPTSIALQVLEGHHCSTRALLYGLAGLACFPLMGLMALPLAAGLVTLAPFVAVAVFSEFGMALMVLAVVMVWTSFAFGPLTFGPLTLREVRRAQALGGQPHGGRLLGWALMVLAALILFVTVLVLTLAISGGMNLSELWMQWRQEGVE